MATITRTIRPARCDATLLRPVVYPCTICPAGIPGVLSLNGDAYALSAITTPAENAEGFTVDGYRFEKIGADSEPRDVAVTPHGLECDCPDALFRRGAGKCKHALACGTLQAAGNLI